MPLIRKSIMICVVKNLIVIIFIVSELIIEKHQDLSFLTKRYIVSLSPLIVLSKRDKIIALTLPYPELLFPCSCPFLIQRIPWPQLSKWLWVYISLEPRVHCAGPSTCVERMFLELPFTRPSAIALGWWTEGL